ncbi:MAG: 6-phosphogluconolactonase [Pseudomonadota bacterium]
MAIAEFHMFDDREALAEGLANRLAQTIKLGIDENQFASVALSGGATPKAMLQRLGARLSADDREMMYLALVDERCVPHDDPRANRTMIKTAAGFDDHPESEFLPLYRDGLSAKEAARAASDKLADDEELPFDVVTLGMGLDGHTASWFPASSGLAQAVDPAADDLVVAVTGDTLKEDRVSLTMPAIQGAHLIVLHIEGADKRDVLNVALDDGPADAMPIRHLLRHPFANLEVYWAP